MINASAWRQIIPPRGGRVYLVFRVPVREDKEWKIIMKAAGIPVSFKHDVVKPATTKCNPDVVHKNFVLVNRPDWGLLDFLRWGKENDLKLSFPIDIISLSKGCPTLNEMVGVDELVVHATEIYPYKEGFVLPFAWWSLKRKGLRLGQLQEVGSHYAWCLFFCGV